MFEEVLSLKLLLKSYNWSEKRLISNRDIGDPFILDFAADRLLGQPIQCIKALGHTRWYIGMKTTTSGGLD